MDYTTISASAANAIDALHVNFSPGALALATVAFALMLFGVALDTPVAAFRSVLRRPGIVGAGLAAQILVLPALAFLLSLALRLPGSVALGMILVACSPAGNVSNVLTYRAKGDVALSVSLSAVGNLLAIVALPLTFMFWGHLHPGGGPILDRLATSVEISVASMLGEVALVILLPSVLGITVARLWPTVAERLKRVLGPFSLVALVGITGAAIASNWSAFSQHLGMIMLVNAAAHAVLIAFGYALGRLVRTTVASTKTLTFEMAARNSTLATLLVFTYFGGLGGMALYTAWSGAWSIIAGVMIAHFWKRHTARQESAVQVPADSAESRLITTAPLRDAALAMRAVEVAA